MIYDKMNSKRNEFLSLFYVIAAWMVIDMLSFILIELDIDIVSELLLALGAGGVCLYGIKTASLKDRFKGFVMVGPLCILSGILSVLLWIGSWTGDRGESFVIVVGILPILSDLIFGTGMERVVRNVSSRLKWAWRIWKCTGVIVGIIPTYTNYKVCSFELKIGGIKGPLGCGKTNLDELGELFYQLLLAFLAYWVFRVIQAVLTLITAKVMKRQEEECVEESKDDLIVETGTEQSEDLSRK